MSTSVESPLMDFDRVSSTSSPIPRQSSTQVSPELAKIIIKKLNGYVGFANLPNQWHRKSIKRGFNLNIMVVGQSGLGKSTLVNTLFGQALYEPKPPRDPAEEIPKTVVIETVSANLEENGVRLHLTVVDTPGFGDFINNTDSWTPIVENIEQRFDEYLEAESKVNRTTVTDNRIHACVYFIEPTGHSLKPLDIAAMKSLHKKVNLIPVIAKSDILTDEEINNFKSTILDDITAQEIDIFQPPKYDNDDEDTVTENNDIFQKVPFAVVGSTTEVKTADGRVVRGRTYPWGTIEVDNEQHCDFIKLRQMLIRNYLEELREKTANVLYENYRREKLQKLGIEQDNTVFREFDPTLRQEEEKSLHNAKLTKMEAEMKNVFEQKVAEKEAKLKKSEAELFARHKEMKDKLTKQLRLLEEKKSQLESARLSEERNSKSRKGFSLR